MNEEAGWLDIAHQNPIEGRRHSGPHSLEAELVVWHYTAGPGSPLGWLMQRTDGVSWHFSVERDGMIRQHASLLDRRGHAGGSIWEGKDNVNGKSIGIEVANLGPVELLKGPDMRPTEWPGVIPAGLSKRNGCRYGREKRSGKRIWMSKDSHVLVDENGDLWEKMPQAQQEAIIRLGLALAAWSQEHESGALTAPERHVGHGAIRTTKRPRGVPEPAPVFPWQALEDNLRALTGVP